MKIILKFLTLIFSIIYLMPSNCQNNPFDVVGLKHNEGVKYVLQRFTTLPSEGNRASTIKNLLQQGYPGVSFEYYPSMPETNVYEYLKAQIAYSRSAQFNNKVDIVKNFLDTNPNVGSINSFMETLAGEASSSIPANELDLYYYFLATVKYSAQLWLPQNMGGEYAITMIPGFGSSNGGGTVSAINWGKVLCADALGCVTAAASSLVASGGASAIPNPLFGGIPTAGVIGAIGGVGGSAGSLLSQW
jgi:hypothetical protein